METYKSQNTLTIETPERVALAFSLASIGNRFSAVVFDHLIQFFLIILVTILINISFKAGGEPNIANQIANEAPKWVIAILIIIAAILYSGYFIFFEWFWNGQTPGKLLMKLRVIREDGRPITLWESISRNLLRLVDSFPGILLPVYSVGLISIFASSRDQRVGDYFAGTVVIRERIGEAPTFAEAFLVTDSDSAHVRAMKPVTFEADLSTIREEEIEVIESFLRRRWDIEERQRAWMAWRVAMPIMFKLRPRYEKENFTYEGFLEELIHRYNQNRLYSN